MNEYIKWLHNRYKRKKAITFSKNIKNRMLSQLILIGLAFLIIFGRIVYIIAIDGEKYSKVVLDQNVVLNKEVLYKRGDILDINGTVLATSIRVYNVILDPKSILDIEDLEKREAALRDVKEILYDMFEIEASEIDKVLEEKAEKYYHELTTKISYDDYLEFQELVESKYENVSIHIWFQEDYIRTYPYNTLASGIIGYIDSEGVGAGGVEKSYNTALTGSNGRGYTYYTDYSKDSMVKEPENGNTLITTIDQTLQSIVEEKVLAFNESYTDNYSEGLGSKNTAVIITNPNTGAILASVSYPNFDLNNPTDISAYYTEEEEEELREANLLSDAIVTIRNNFITNERFEAGSTIKPFTVAAALESGVIDGSETYYCGGSLRVADYTIRCANRDGHGEITLEESIAHSCNVAMMLMAEKMGVDIFTAAQKNFGFGPTTGSDLPNEKSTMDKIYTADTMGVTDLATNSFGQNFEVTVLQMVAGTAALINGGNYYKPYVVQQVQDSSGRIVSNTEPTLVRKIVSESTVDVIQNGMRAVVEYGTAKRAAVEGYDIGGKTGTAEKLPRGNGKYLVSFIGGVPISDPEILIYVIVDEPNAPDQSGTGMGAIIAGQILEEALPYLGISKKEEVIETIE